VIQRIPSWVDHGHHFLVVPETFNWLVECVRLMLDTHYPVDVFDGSTGDPGDLFLTSLREALKQLEPPDPEIGRP
jgi:hypothetical protein